MPSQFSFNPQLLLAFYTSEAGKKDESNIVKKDTAEPYLTYTDRYKGLRRQRDVS